MAWTAVQVGLIRAVPHAGDGHRRAQHRGSRARTQADACHPRRLCAARVGARQHDGCDLLEETLDRTNLKQLRRDSPVNLERALAAGAPMGGHFVQGHIDCSAKVILFERTGEDYRLEVDLPSDFAHYAAYKGSVAINGISLTIAELLAKSFAVCIIPHTKRHTNIDKIEADDLVNIEFDILAKYVERMLARYAPQD